jgi:hypothetical protein
MRIAAHIRVKTGHNNPAAYHNNGSSEEEKIARYKEIAKAILSGDLSTLQGDVAGGQATVPVEAPADVPVIEPDPEPEKKEVVKPREYTPVAAVVPELDTIKKLREALEGIGIRGGGGAVLDEKAVVYLIERTVKPMIDEALVKLRAGFNEEIANALSEDRQRFWKSIEDIKSQTEETVNWVDKVKGIK